MEAWIEKLHKDAESCKLSIKKYQQLESELLIPAIEELVECVEQNKGLSKKSINSLNKTDSYQLVHFLDEQFTVTRNNKKLDRYHWTTADPLIISLLTKINFKKNSVLACFVSNFFLNTLYDISDIDFQNQIEIYHSFGYTSQEIVMITLRANQYIDLFFVPDHRNEKDQNTNPFYSTEFNAFGNFVLKILEEEKGNELTLINSLKNFFKDKDFDYDLLFSWFKLLIIRNIDLDKNRIENFVVPYAKRYEALSVDYLLFLIQIDPFKYEDFVINVANDPDTIEEDKISIYYALDLRIREKYKQTIIDFNETHFQKYHNKNLPTSYYSYDYCAFGGYLYAYLNFLSSYDIVASQQWLQKFIKEAQYFPRVVLTYIYDEIEESKQLDYFLEFFEKDGALQYRAENEHFISILFLYLNDFDLSDHLQTILDFLEKTTQKTIREFVSTKLIPYQHLFGNQARALLEGKTVNQRVLGAILLADWQDDSNDEILNETLETEVNDDIRDIMLESLAAKRFRVSYSIEQVSSMINFADQRKKLDSFREKWLSEKDLPALYYITGEKLSEKDIRFLFYRMSRAKGINSDIEAKQLIQVIDKEKSGVFGKMLLNAFQESNADVKLKHYLTIAALTGNDTMTYQLHALFNKNMADKRMKMAQYVVGALAMVGTDKALRIVEVISRKFATQKPSLSEAALDALQAAAQEFNITIDQLADRIIPDFGFEGLYKTFDVEGEEHRAFVSADFKLHYLSEDNKLRKSVPPKTSKELKSEFKEIEKEIRDVIKSQGDRLEKYMIEARKWTVAEWREFFFENPIMFVFGLRLIWGVFDTKGNLLHSFYCSEDASCYDIEDEEIEFDESNSNSIRIMHPAYLSVDEVVAWKDKLYNLEISTIFPILERSVYRVEKEELDSCFTQKFLNQNVPKGADFVNTFLVKRHWLKRAGDGSASEFTKLNKNWYAYANIEGPQAYYQGEDAKATVYEISFYDKTTKEQIELKHLPSIFYSEVMYDIELLLED